MRFKGLRGETVIRVISRGFLLRKPCGKLSSAETEIDFEGGQLIVVPLICSGEPAASGIDKEPSRAGCALIE